MAKRASSNETRRICVERHKVPHPFIDGREIMYCADCDAQIDIGLSYWEADHRVPVALGGSNEPDNIEPRCQHCHKLKTTKKDIPTIAKVTRTREKHQGIRRSFRPMPFGKHSGLKKKLNGDVVPR